MRILFHDQVDQAPLLSFFGVHEEVALHRALDVLERPAGVLRVDAGHGLALAKDLLRVQLDVGRLALEALSERLVDEVLRGRQRPATPWFPPAKHAHPPPPAPPLSPR